MDPLRVVVETGGVFLRGEARDVGYDDKAVADAIRAGVWVRVRRGAYTFRDIWDAEDVAGRHAILSRAVIRSLGDRVALSHVSAAVEHGCATWGVDLTRVHVTRLDGGAGRTEKDVVHHEGRCLDDDVVHKHSLVLTHPARACIETATLGSVEAGLVTADSMIHLGHVTSDELGSRFRAMERWPATRKVHLVLGLADGRAESPGETRSRFLCWASGLAAPQLQFHVFDQHGRLVGITDFAWPEHRLLGEFDGKVKYGRLLSPGEKPEDVVFREKRREDLLREVTSYAMIRLTWADLHRPAQTVARFRRLMRLAG